MLQTEVKPTARKLTRGDLANINGATLILGCCLQGCCKAPFPLELSENKPN